VSATTQTPAAPGFEPCPRTVLIADDDAIYRHLLQTQLLQWGYQVVVVENGLEAWSALQAEDAPKMAILDWMMPGLDGIGLCRRIRSQTSGGYRYVLLLTARNNKADVVAGLEAGADDYLTKPFDVDELRARARAGQRILELQDALIKAREALQFEAAHDRLTGLWNRGAIMDLLHRESQRCARGGQPLGVIIADLDHFKQINDRHGHLAGDAVLRDVGRRLVEAVRNYDYVGRYGGEEFLIVLADCAASDLASTAERIRCHVAECAVHIGPVQISVTVSLGLVSTIARRPEAVLPEELVRAADTALYCAKANGRNRAESATLICSGQPA
jgi:two-component system, cell cycle response regulator